LKFRRVRSGVNRDFFISKEVVILAKTFNYGNYNYGNYNYGNYNYGDYNYGNYNYAIFNYDKKFTIQNNENQMGLLFKSDQ
jgi:hypothetical protein